MLKRLNDLPIFDSARWPAREMLARVVGILAVTAFVLRRILQLPSWPGYIREVDWVKPFFNKLSFLPSVLLAAPFDLDWRYAYFGYTREQVRILWSLEFMVWILETGILVGYVAGFLTRAPAKAPARGFMESVYPLLLALLPFAITMTSYTYPQWMPEHVHTHLRGLYALNMALVAGAALNVLGLFTLRKAFTITSEARVFVSGGIYSLIRHPLYTAHFLIYFCYTLLHLQPLTVGLYGIFVAGQTLRARIEERKLAAAFPEYEGYRQATGMFLPKLRG